MRLFSSRKKRAKQTSLTPRRLWSPCRTFKPRLEQLEERTLLNAGALDPTFGIGGKVTTHFGGFDNGRELAIQPDGKIVVVGSVVVNSVSDFGLARYNSDGSLDSTFGTGGDVITDVGGNGDPDGVVILPNGKILLAGEGSNGGSSTAFALAKYTASGSLDTTFGTGGEVFTKFTSGNDFATGLAVQADGKIVVAGNANFNGTYGHSDSALARYNPDGSLDTTFGTGGQVIMNVADHFHRLAIQSDGRIVVAGDRNTGSSWDFALARFNTDGTLDGNFGTGGKVTTDFSGFFDEADAVAILGNGQIVAAGQAYSGTSNATSDFALARYNANGSLDTSFGMGGKVTAVFNSGNDFIGGIAIQRNGQIVVAGEANYNSEGDFALARFNDNYPGLFQEFPTPPNSQPDGITAGPDGALWFGEYGANKVGRITTTGVLTEFPVPNVSGTAKPVFDGNGNFWFSDVVSTGQNTVTEMTQAGQVLQQISVPDYPHGGATVWGLALTRGPDGNIWFTEPWYNPIMGRINSDGTITQFSIPFPAIGLTKGSDGNFWFEATTTNYIGRIDSAGVVQVFAIPDRAVRGLTSGPDGNLWMTAADNTPGVNEILQVNTQGQLTGRFAIPTPNSGGYDMTSGLDGALWFTEFFANQIGRISVADGSFTEFPIPTTNSGTNTIATGPDGNIWFTESTANKIGEVVLHPPGAVYWINPAGGDWDTASNWSTGVVPGANDDVTITLLESNATVTHSAANDDSIHSLTFYAGKSDSLSISAGSLSIAAASSFTTFSSGSQPLVQESGGALTINGDLSVATGIQLSGGAFTGNGNITTQNIDMSGGAFTGNGKITAQNIHMSGGTFTGNGNIASLNIVMSGGTFTGNSNVIALPSSNSTSSIQLSGGTFIGNGLTYTQSFSVGSLGTFTGNGNIIVNGLSLAGGTIRGPQGSSLTTRGGMGVGGGGTIDGRTLNNAGTAYWQSGTIYASNGAVFNNLPGAIFNDYTTGGMFISTDASGPMFNNAGYYGRNPGGSTLIGVGFNNTGSLDVGSASTLTLSGAFSNFSNSTLSGGTYYIGGTLQFTGAYIVTNAAEIGLLPGGQIVNEANANGLANFAHNAPGAFFSQRTGSTLSLPGSFSNDSGAYFDVSGNLTTLGSFSNAGNVSVGSGLLTVGGSFSNTGIVTEGDGTLAVDGNYTQTGGHTLVLESTLASGSGMGLVSILGGVLDGDGTVKANVLNLGQVMPGELGNTPGPLTITGNYTDHQKNLTGTLTINLNLVQFGLGPIYEKLYVGGTVDLAGTLDVENQARFPLVAGDSYQILFYASRMGKFSSIIGANVRAMYTKTSLTIVIQPHVAALLSNGSGYATNYSDTGGTLLPYDIALYVDNSNGDLTADELARIQDAVTAVDAVTEPHGVAVAEVTDPTQADVTLNMDTTSAVGGYPDGVLGCTTNGGQITLIQGWSFYAGTDPTAIGAGQYDFQTVVTHELGHALGLGHSANAASVMYATLTTGTANRTLAVADLNVPDSDTSGACGLHAEANSKNQEPSSKNEEPISKNQIRSAPALEFGSWSRALEFGSWFFEFAILAPAGYQTQLDSPTAHQTALNTVLVDWPSAADSAGQVARILDDKEAMGAASHSQARLAGPAENDDFWSAIVRTPSWIQIIN